jgi:hypothetical protein
MAGFLKETGAGYPSRTHESVHFEVDFFPLIPTHYLPNLTSLIAISQKRVHWREIYNFRILNTFLDVMQTIRFYLFNNPDKTFYSIILYINDAMECDVQKRTKATSNKPQIEASVSRQKDKRTLHRIQKSTTFVEYKLMTIPKE